LIRELEDLHDGEDIVPTLVSLGELAIPRLKKYLLEGSPSHIYQPRQRAVRVLAKLGAKAVLLEYLAMPKEIGDPVLQFGEEAVENTAARALAHWRTEEVFQSLLKIAGARNLPGVIETLGLFRRPEAVPLFIGALQDDMCNAAAEKALRLLGRRARPALVEALSRNMREADEDPGVLVRRRSAIRVLSTARLSGREWMTVRGLLDDRDIEISVTAAKMTLNTPGGQDKSVALRKLIEAIPQADWFIQAEIENAILKQYDFARDAVDKEIAERSDAGEENAREDRTLRTLLYLKKKAQERRGGSS